MADQKISDSKRDFQSAFTSLAQVAAESTHQFFADHLAQWFLLLDETPEIAQALVPLDLEIDYKAWLTKYTTDPAAQIGEGRIVYPPSSLERLAAQFTLFRIFSRGEIEAFRFGHRYISSRDTQFDRVTQNVSIQIYTPFVLALRRYLDREWNDAASVPAADRLVSLDHNSSQYKEAVEALNKVRDAVAESNGYADAADQERRVHELAAGGELLKATQVNASSFHAVTVVCLKYLADKFAGGVIGALAKIALYALAAIFGVHLK